MIVQRLRAFTRTVFRAPRFSLPVAVAIFTCGGCYETLLGDEYHERLGRSSVLKSQWHTLS